MIQHALVATLYFCLAATSAEAMVRGAVRKNAVGTPILNCHDEISMDINCKENCDTTAQPQDAACKSKIFLYNGGPCQPASTARANKMNPVLQCQDFHNSPPIKAGAEVFVVVTDLEEPSRTSRMFTTVGGHFLADFVDYPKGQGLSGRQNITIYSSDETTLETMLQTMIFEAECDSVLEELDLDQSVQMLGLRNRIQGRDSNQVLVIRPPVGTGTSHYCFQ